MPYFIFFCNSFYKFFLKNCNFSLFTVFSFLQSLYFQCFHKSVSIFVRIFRPFTISDTSIDISLRAQISQSVDHVSPPRAGGRENLACGLISSRPPSACPSTQSARPSAARRRNTPSSAASSRWLFCSKHSTSSHQPSDGIPALLPDTPHTPTG